MKKISVSNLIKFRDKTPKTKLSFLKQIQKEKAKDEKGGGGDYWTSCVSAVSNVFPDNDTTYLDDKIEELIGKRDATELKPVKDRWQANIDIVSNFYEFDYNSLKPNTQLLYPKKGTSTVDVKAIPIVAKPQHVFTFINKGKDEIGAVWFVAVKHGYSNSDLGIFSEMIYRYLTQNYGKKYTINPEFCITVDASTTRYTSYNDLLIGDIPFLLDVTVDEVKEVLFPPKQ